MKMIQRLAIGILLPLSVVLAGGRKAVTLVPVNGKSVTLIINGKEKEYYALSSSTPIKLQVDGPGKLTIISRLRLPKDNAGAEKYTIRVVEGKTKLKTQSTQTEKSDAIVKSSDNLIGKSRKFSLNIAEGSFTYEFWLDDTPREAAAKFLLTPSKNSGNLVAIEPLSYDRVVTAKIKENLIAYYVASKDRPVQFRVVGPTKIQVSVRLNYDEKMKGEQKYSLIISDGEKSVAQKLLHTTKSVGLSYEDWKEVVPGKVNSVSITVPNGEHKYQVTLGETIAHSVSLKFSIPKKDLMNGK